MVAHEIVDGGLPYVNAIERKPPLLFWTYAAIFKVAGKYNWPLSMPYHRWVPFFTTFTRFT